MSHFKPIGHLCCASRSKLYIFLHIMTSFWTTNKLSIQKMFLTLLNNIFLPLQKRINSVFITE